MSVSVVPASGPLESRKIRVAGTKGIKVAFSSIGSAGKAGPRTPSPSSRLMVLLSSSDRPAAPVGEIPVAATTAIKGTSTRLEGRWKLFRINQQTVISESSPQRGSTMDYLARTRLPTALGQSPKKDMSSGRLFLDPPIFQQVRDHSQRAPPYRIRSLQKGGHGDRSAPDGGDAWAPAKPRPDETLIRALARAHRWKRMLEDGKYRSAAELAEAEGVTRSFVNRLLRLTLLAPDIVGGDPRRPSAEGHAAGRADRDHPERLG